MRPRVAFSLLIRCCSGVVAKSSYIGRKIGRMAIIQYTGIVNQIRGKLNGSVFNKSRSVNTLQRKQQAPRRQVGRSATPRNRFSNAQRSWKALTNGQRNQWATAANNNPSRNRFGDLVPLAGYNQYVKAHMFATYAGVTPPTTPDTNPAPDPEFFNDGFGIYSFGQDMAGNTSVSLLLGWFRENTLPDFQIIIDFGLPVSAGVTVYYGRYQFAYATPATEFGTAEPTVQLGTRYPLPQPGQVVYGRIRLVYIPNGTVVYTEVERLDDFLVSPFRGITITPGNGTAPALLQLYTADGASAPPPGWSTVVYRNTDTGECPTTFGFGTNDPAATSAINTVGQYTFNDPVSPGDCEAILVTGFDDDNQIQVFREIVNRSTL